MNHDIGGPGTTEDRVMCGVCDVLIGRVFVTSDDRIININISVIMSYY